VAFTYDDTLADVRSRVRFAVGDTANPGLLPDATYDAQIAREARSAQAFTATAADDTCQATAHGYADGASVVPSWLVGADPLVEGTVYYVRDAEADTFALSATAGGTAINITTDGQGLVARVDEQAAIRAVAGGLAAKFAIEPDSLSENGTAIRWGERVAQWRLIAQGLAGGATAGRAKGWTLRRGAAVDYTTGEGDA
jgi:hypothetical protein